MDRSVLRVGGWAGILAGVLVLVALIVSVALAPPTTFPPDFEQNLVDFLANPTPQTVGQDLAIISLLLILPFLAAIYRTLREPSRTLARIGLGSSVLATVLLIVGFAGLLEASRSFSALYDGAAIADRPVVVAAFAVVWQLLGAGNVAGIYLFGLAFVAFGLAMRASPDYQEGFAWLSVVLGIITVLLPLLILGLASALLLAVFALVLGWKVYSLSRAA